jgi:phage replication O-like protein O
MEKWQEENGTYTRIANNILEALAKYPSLGSEASQVLWLIIRRTYGFQQTTAEMSVSFIAKGTGLKESNVCRAITRLLSKQIIKRKENRITFNRKCKEWILSKRIRLSNKITPIIQTDNETLSYKRDNKETNKETFKETLPQAAKPKTSIQIIVDYFFELKGFGKDNHPPRIYGSYVKPAKDLLELCDGSIESAKNKLKKIANWANACQIDWSLETVFKRWHEIDGLEQQIEKRKKPFIDGDRAYQKNGSWFIITKSGEHRKYIGDLSKLTYETC